MQGIDWGILERGQARTQAMFQQGMDAAADMLRRRSMGNALADLQADPSNQKAMGYLYREAPQLALTMQDRARETETRNALAGLVLGGGGGAPQAAPFNALMPPTPGLGDTSAGAQAGPAGMVAPTGPGRGVPPPGPVRNPAFERAVRADPAKALELQGKRVKLSADQFEMMRGLNEASLQLLGGVHDQASYEAAIQRAQSLYGQFGLDLSALNLPAQYDPQTVDGLMRQAMRTKDQFAVMTAENRLDWDIEDDRIDNSRADAALSDLSSYRQGQLSNTRRGQDMTDSRVRRGQDLTDSRGRRGQDMADQRGRRGQDMTDKRARDGAGGRKGKGGGGDLIGTVYQRGGKRIQYSKSKGGYVDLATGQVVQ